MNELSPAFEVHINGRKVCLAGVGKYGVLTTTLTYVLNEPDLPVAPENLANQGKALLHVGGLVEDVHCNWLEENVSVSIGDEVTIKVIETSKVDDPVEQHQSAFPVNPEQVRRARFEHYMAYKREFEGLDSTFAPEYPPDSEAAAAVRYAIYLQYAHEFEQEENES